MKFFKWIYLLLYILISSLVLGFVAVFFASEKYGHLSGAGFEGVFYIVVLGLTALISVSSQLLLVGAFLIFKGVKNGD